MRRVAALAVLGAVALATPAVAGTFAVGASGGWVKPDAGLADYQWDTRPGAAWGASARAERGAWGAGLRLLRGRSTQDVGTAAPAAVHTTRAELVGRRRVARVLGQEVALTASAGRMRLAYDPDRVTIDGAGGPMTVELAPVGSWTAGLGLAIERAVSGRLVAGIEADGVRYGFDTAHRAGDTIVRERTAFTDWGARITLAWRSAP